MVHCAIVSPGCNIGVCPAGVAHVLSAITPLKICSCWADKLAVARSAHTAAPATVLQIPNLGFDPQNINPPRPYPRAEPIAEYRPRCLLLHVLRGLSNSLLLWHPEFLAELYCRS